MTALPYSVFIVTYPPWKADTGATASPIETVIAGDTSGTFTISGRIEGPQVPPIMDTQISLCGKKNCNGCSGNQCIRSASPDYSIFNSILEQVGSTPTNGIVVIKTTTVSSSTDASHLSNSLTNAIAASSSALDVFFFAKWLDRPEQYETLLDLQGGGKIVRTWNANGFQAIAFTPQGFAKLSSKYPPTSNPVVCRPFSQVINTLIQVGELYAATTTPSLLQYDSTLVSLRAANSAPEAPFSYLKTCETRGDTHPERPLNRRISADLSLFWVVIVIIVVLLSSWVLLKIGAIYRD